MGDDSSRRALEGHLALLLGFDEVSDVFEHLLTIEEEDDLSEYLSALLGLEGHAVSDFVQDMSRFQRGEKLVNISIVDKAGSATDTSAGVTAASSRKHDEEDKVEEKMSSMTLEPKPQKQEQKKSKHDKSMDKRAKLNEKRKQKQQKKEKLGDFKATEATHVQENADDIATRATSKSPETAQEGKRNDAPKPPQRGTASKVCGCFGTVHKPITNCLHCGRIACETEGYDYCGFCGYLIEKVTDVERNSNGKFDKALLHKERLLKYDREFTKRTHVYDDQADYFSNTTSVWLDEHERNDAEERDTARQKDIHERKKQTLTLDL